MNKQKLNIVRSSAMASIIALSIMTSCQKEESVEAETADEAKNHIISKTNDGETLHTFKLPGGKIANILEDKEGRYLEDDIIVSKADFNAVKIGAQNQTEPRLTRRGGYTRLWPGGVIYYTTATLAIHNAVQQAIAEMDPPTGIKHAGIKFVQISNPQPGQNYIAFVPSGGYGSFSPIGMQGGRQELAIASHLNKYILIHEILHALGFAHEHTRPDRGNYINILWNNIDVNQHGQEILSNWYIHPNNIGKGEFDYNSVMLYGSYDFAKPYTVTMTRKDNGQPLVNNWDHWSVYDRKYLREYYPKYPNQP